LPASSRAWVTSHDGRLESTTSLRPNCLERVPGHYERRNGEVHLTRTCEEHGTTTRTVWGSVDHREWADGSGVPGETYPTGGEENGCCDDPGCCGDSTG